MTNYQYSYENEDFLEDSDQRLLQDESLSYNEKSEQDEWFESDFRERTRDMMGAL